MQRSTRLSLIVILLINILSAVAAYGAPTLSWHVTPWRSVIFQWTLPKAALYISPKPITTVHGLTPYRIAPVNLGWLWETSYTYDPETDTTVCKTDDSAGSPKFPDLTDGIAPDDMRSCVMTPDASIKHFTPIFTFDKPYLVSSIKLDIGTFTQDLPDPSTVEVYAGLSRTALTRVADTTVTLPQQKIGAIEVPFPTVLAKYIKVRLTTKNKSVRISEVELFGTNNYPTEQQVEVNDLAIGGHYYAAVAAGGKLVTTQVDIPKVFEKADMSEHFGINVHFETMYGNMADIEKSAKLISAAGIKYYRWYPAIGCERVINLFKEYGVAPYMLGYVPCVATGCGNEPEGANPPRTPQSVVDFILLNRKIAKQNNAMYLVGGPTTMAQSADYVKQVLRLLKPEQLDFFDFHPYVGAQTEVAPGLAKGVPENVAIVYRQNRAALIECGFGNKPIVASEFGYSTCQSYSKAETITPAQQAYRLVRSMLANTAQGAALCIWYDYRNDGTEPYNNEHNFGIVTNDLQTKPAYYAYQYLTKMVGDKKYVGLLPNMPLPTLGYDFAALTGTQHTYVLVNAGHQRSTITLQNAPRNIALFDIYGHSLPFTSLSASTTVLTVDESPVYLVSPKAVRIASATTQPLPAIPENTVTVTLPNTSLIAQSSGTALCPIQLTNTYTHSVTANVSAACGGFIDMPTTAVKIQPGATTTVQLTAKLKDITPGVFPLKVTVSSEAGKSEEEANLYVIKHDVNTAQAYLADINRDGKNEAILENENLNVVLTPSAGSRVFRIIDKRTNADQLFMPPSAQGCLADITLNLLAGEFISTMGYGGFICSSPFDAKILTTETGVSMHTVAQELDITHQVILPKNSSNTIEQRYTFKNVATMAKDFTFNTHPEFVPGGSIRNGQVTIEIPTANHIQKDTFVKDGFDVGGKPMPDAGWWKITNNDNGYAITCTFDTAQTDYIRQWHGDLFFNMELNYKKVHLQPGESITYTYSYSFTPQAK